METIRVVRIKRVKMVHVIVLSTGGKEHIFRQGTSITTSTYGVEIWLYG